MRVEAINENEIVCSFAFGWKRVVRPCGGWSRRWNRAGLPGVRLLCSAASGLCTTGNLRSTRPGSQLRVGRWLLVSLRRPVCGLLGSPAVCGRSLGGAALLRTSLVRRTLAVIITVAA